MIRLGLRLTPHGRLVCELVADAPGLDEAVATRLREAFARGSGDGLLRLGAGEVGQALPPVFVWWRDFATRYVASLCAHVAGAEGGQTGAAVLPEVPPPDQAELDFLVLTGPMMQGAEYLTAEVLRGLWAAMAASVAAALTASGAGLQEFLKRLNPAWNLVGRVHFNLAENRRDPNAPFAFMATYASQLSAQARVQHLPLGQALREYGGAANRPKLLSLLLPVQRAAETCAWLQPMIDSGEIFHPLRWSPQDAARLLASAAELERAGVVLRMPAGWQAGRPAAPAGHRDGRRARTLEARAGRAAGLLRGDDAGRRDPERDRGPAAARRHRHAGAAARPLGGGGPPAARTHADPVPRGGSPRAHGGAELRRGDAHAGRRQPHRGCGPTPPRPNGRA